MELHFDPAIPLLGLYPKSPETPIQKNLCTPMFIAAQFTIAKCWKQPKCLSVKNVSKNPGASLFGMQTGAATVENSMGFSQKTKNGTAF